MAKKIKATDRRTDLRAAKAKLLVNELERVNTGQPIPRMKTTSTGREIKPGSIIVGPRDFCPEG